MVHPTRLRALGRLGVPFLAIAVLLAALELGARVFYIPTARSAARTYVSADPTLPELTTFVELDRHEQRGLYRGMLYETNHLRLRSPERPLDKPPNVTRIAVLGDSYVMGDGVLVEDTYAWRLEEEMTRVRPGRYESINTGLSGLDATHAVQRYAELGLPYHPDIAVYGFTINDIEGPHYVKTATPLRDRYALESSPLTLWRVVGPGYVALRERFLPPAGSYVAELRRNYFDNAAAWSDFAAALDRLADVNESHGICSVLFLHTHLVTLNALHPFTSIYDKVAEAGHERGFLTIPSLPAHLGLNEKPLWVSSADSHPNREGHRLLAATLAEGLAALPVECFR